MGLSPPPQTLISPDSLAAVTPEPPDSPPPPFSTTNPPGRFVRRLNTYQTPTAPVINVAHRAIQSSGPITAIEIPQLTTIHTVAITFTRTGKLFSSSQSRKTGPKTRWPKSQARYRSSPPREKK